jgi:hypothetical protein
MTNQNHTSNRIELPSIWIVLAFTLIGAIGTAIGITKQGFHPVLAVAGQVVLVTIMHFIAKAVFGSILRSGAATAAPMDETTPPAKAFSQDRLLAMMGVSFAGCVVGLGAAMLFRELTGAAWTWSIAFGCAVCLFVQFTGIVLVLSRKDQTGAKP